MIFNLRTALIERIPLLPPMDAPDGYCLHYSDPATGELRGGYSLLGEVQEPFTSVQVQVECSEAVFARMIEDPALNLGWWEAVGEA
jgi:hypothetical protein